MNTALLFAIKRICRAIIPVQLLPPSSYSQSGEDAILRFLFNTKGMAKVSYLDIGTNIPDFGNNTYTFYCKGSKGVCVEADKTLIPQIKKMRPRDKVLNVGVSINSAKSADFYIFNFGLNTFNKSEAIKRSKSGKFKIIEIAKVPLIDINTLIKNNFTSYPDLLSIDIEGLDFPVLKTLNFKKYPIPVLCIETCQYSENHIRQKDQKIIDFMVSKGYFVYADTYINTIFVQKNWFYSL